jgi:peptide/nickel transport system substrate-binding protein
MSLSLDRRAFIDILTEGEGDIGGVMQPPPSGLWGMPPDLLRTLRGYDPDVRNNRALARALMQKLGYGPDKPLALTVSTRNLAPYRDPAVILIDQLKEIYVDGVLDPLDTTQWYPKLMRKDYAVGLNITETAVDDPDPAFYENYVCGAVRNYTGYATPRSTRWSTPSRLNPTSRSASIWCERSRRNWPATTRGRSCSTTGSPTAGTPRSSG